MNLNELTILQSSEGLRKKQFSSAELTQAVFDQIKKTDSDIGAYLSLNEEGAMRRAKEIDQELGRGKDLPVLAGIPVAIKDNMLVQGLNCTAGSKILENYIAPHSGTCVSRLQQAGAVIIGKTNMDEFAMGSSTENSAFKKTKNPRDLARVPGGSSGGSAAAVAANETIFALGSDTGGSIRQPASFCGVVGLKPTYGAVSRFGLMAMASSLDQIGPLTKSVADCQVAFDAIKEKDQLDSTSLESKIQNSRLDIRNLKIGLPKEYFAEGIDPAVEELVNKAIKKMQAAGADVREISLPHTEYALACYYIIMPSEVSANLARYDGVKYGYSEFDKAGDLMEAYLGSRQHGFGDEPRRRIMLGTYALSAGYYDAYYLKAQKVRTLIKQDFEKAFNPSTDGSANGVDVIMTPTSPTPAFKFGEKGDDPIKMYLSDIYTVSANLAGVPAISVPCGHAQRGQSGDIDGLPVGLQIIGPHFGESIIFQVALAYESI